MAFFCPMFPKHRQTNDDYECSTNLPTVGAPRLYATRSLGALNAQPENECWTSAVELNQFSPYTPARISLDFTATVDDELSVKQGQTLTALYREDDWIYLVAQDKTQGFVPSIYCQLQAAKHPDTQPRRSPPCRTLAKKKRSGSLRKTFGGLLKHRSKSQELSSIVENNNHAVPQKPPIQSPKAAQNVNNFLESLERPQEEEEPEAPVVNVESKTPEQHLDVGCEFRKEPSIQSVAIYDFTSSAEDDLCVTRGQTVTVLNREDTDWFWVRHEATKAEGFVPSNRLAHLDGADNESLVSSDSSNSSKGCEFVVTRDLEAEAPDDLTVRKGDWVYTKQMLGEGWLWAYCPRTRMQGFLPAQYIKAPVSTVL